MLAVPVNKLYDRGTTVLHSAHLLRDRIGHPTIYVNPDAAKKLAVEAGELVHVKGLIPWLSVVPVAAFLLLTRWRRFRQSTSSMLPTPHLRWRGDEFLRDLNVLLAAYTLSALMAGCGGALIAMTTRHVTPQLAYWTTSGELVFIAILGGIGSALGPFLGAVVYELVRVYAAAAMAELWQLILGAVLLLVILFASRGLWGAIEGLTRPKRSPS